MNISNRKLSKIVRSFRRKSKVRFFKMHPYVVPLIVGTFLFAILAATLISFNAVTIGPTDVHTVRIRLDGQDKVLPTRTGTVAEFLESIKVSVEEGAIVEPGLKTPIDADNIKISVMHPKPIVVFDKGKKTQVLSASRAPREIAEKAGITVYPEDKVELTRVEEIGKEGIASEKVVINRASVVNLNLYGAAVVIRTNAKTLNEMLVERNIKLVEGDTIEPKADTILTDNATVFITKIGKKVASIEEPIAFPTESTNDPSLTKGTVQIKRAGVNGKKVVTYETELKNNVEVSRKIIQETIVAGPISQQQVVGSKVNAPVAVVSGDKSSIMSAAGISSGDYGAVDYIISHESGWNAGARNRSSGAYGLCQALPASKMASAGSDWETNPVTQLRWCTGYASSRYGSWQGAYTFWIYNHWW